MSGKEMEYACWIDWRTADPGQAAATRVYFGHETCQELLPPPEAARELAAALRGRGKQLTLVTPFLTNEGLDAARRLIDAILAVSGGLEVVCSDWGLLECLSRQRIAEPILGRLLASQPADPRLPRLLDPRPRTARTVRHLDGTLCRVKLRPPSPALARHLRGAWLDKPEVIAFLLARGIRRAELSNVAQGIELAAVPGWSYSLHLPEVLVAVMRRCPGAGEDFNRPADCRCPRCDPAAIPWRLPSLPYLLFRRDNALFYRQPEPPADLAALPIDRLVVRAPSMGPGCSGS